MRKKDELLRSLRDETNLLIKQLRSDQSSLADRTLVQLGGLWKELQDVDAQIKQPTDRDAVWKDSLEVIHGLQKEAAYLIQEQHHSLNSELKFLEKTREGFVSASSSLKGTAIQVKG